MANEGRGVANEGREWPVRVASEGKGVVSEDGGGR